MRTAILFGGKYGSTEKIARKIADSLGKDSKVFELSKEKNPDLQPFDTLIIGSGVYIGQIRKEVRAFVKKYSASFLDKKIGLFLCCMENKPEEVEGYFKKNFPDGVLQKAKIHKRFPGALVRPQKLGFILRGMYDNMEKTNAERKEPVDQWIQEFLSALK